MQLKNEFGWSLSREAMFDQCKRKYYYHYYLSWGGWREDAGELAKEAFKLKRLVSLALWRGQLVHYIISKILESIKRRGVLPDRKRVIEYTKQHFYKQFTFSEEKRYLIEPKRKQNKLNIYWLALIDHEYNRSIPSDKLEQTLKEVTSAIIGFYSSPIIDILKDTDTAEWVIENVDVGEFAQHFIFEGVKIFVKTDFCFRGTGNTFCIVDWKTISPDSEGKGEVAEQDNKIEIQLGIYSYYAWSVLSESPSMIRLYLVNLLDNGKISEYRVDESSLPIFESYIRNGIKKLASVLEDSDTEKNIPLPIDYFPQIDSPVCSRCNFFRICKGSLSNTQ